jgi:hypothetical protein
MSKLNSFLRSLLITSILSFLAPLLLIGSIAIALIALNQIPQLGKFSQVGFEQLSHFLLIFGSGSSLYGVLTLCVVSSLVSILFDAYTFYRYQGLRDS